MGSDLDVVNNARVSFDNESDMEFKCVHCGADRPPSELYTCLREAEGDTCLGVFKPRLKDRDRHLIEFLARGCSSGDWDKLIETMTYDIGIGRKELEEMVLRVRQTPTHWAPFANGTNIALRISAAMPIMTQVFKHKVGSVESGISRRYVSDEPTIFYPKFRAAAANKKQGSSYEDFPAASTADRAYERAVVEAVRAYDQLLDLGVCPEQARFVLPQGTVTEAIITHSLYGWANFVIQRQDREHAQGEIADIADEVARLVEPLFPVSWAALMKY